MQKFTSFCRYKFTVELTYYMMLLMELKIHGTSNSAEYVKTSEFV